MVDLRRRWVSLGVEVVVVYVSEAHARDVWPIGDAISRSVQRPSTDGERCALACRMCEELEMDLPVYVDSIQDCFEAEFAPWPFRFYILDKKARLRYKSQPTKDLTHCPVELERALERATCV